MRIDNTVFEVIRLSGARSKAYRTINAAGKVVPYTRNSFMNNIKKFRKIKSFTHEGLTVDIYTTAHKNEIISRTAEEIEEMSQKITEYIPKHVAQLGYTAAQRERASNKAKAKRSTTTHEQI